MVVKLFKFSKQASSSEKVFEESPLALRLSLVCSNSAHTSGQAVIKTYPAPPWAPANVLTGELRCGQCSQGAPSQGLHQWLSLLVPPPSRAVLPLPEWVLLLSLGATAAAKILHRFRTGKSSLWGTVKCCLKGKLRWPRSVHFKGNWQSGREILTGSFEFLWWKLRSLANEICCICLQEKWEP